MFLIYTYKLKYLWSCFKKYLWNYIVNFPYQKIFGKMQAVKEKLQDMNAMRKVKAEAKAEEKV